MLCGAAQADNNGPNNIQRAVEVHRHSVGKELVVFAGCVSQDELLLSPGAVGHRRSDRKDGFARVLLRFAPCSKGLYLFVGQCQVTRDQFSMEQDECPEEKPHPKPATAPGKGMFELWACLRSLTKRRKEKKNTQNTNQGLCYPGFPFWKHLPFLVLNLPVHFRSMFKCTTL